MPKFTVVSTMKNEAPYILEWVAHYKALGFDDIVIATNDCSDPTVRIIKRLEEFGHARLHQTAVRAGGIHRSALRQAARYDEVTSADWIFVCDVDEFLNLHVGQGRIQDLVDSAGEDADAISVPWRIFGPNGVARFEDKRVTTQFTKGELPFDAEVRPDTGKFVKSLYRNTDKIGRMGLHAPIAKKERLDEYKWVLASGEIYNDRGKRTEAPPTFDLAQVNHYALRSLDSYLIKRDRGRANHSHHVLGAEYWDKFNLNDCEDHTIRRYDTEIERWMGEFLDDFRLKKLHNRAIVWHQNKSEALRSDPEMADLLSHLERTL